MIEIILATGLGVVAYLLTEDGICGKHGAEKCKGFFPAPVHVARRRATR